MNDDSAAERDAGAEPSPARDDTAAWATLGAVSREVADTYLEEQIVLPRAQAGVLRLQAHELKGEVRLRHWSLSHLDMSGADAALLAKWIRRHG